MKNGSCLAMGLVLLLAACHGKDSNPAAAAGTGKPASKASVPVKRGPSPEELTAGMVEAVSVSKSAGRVALKFDLPARPEVGKPLEVNLALLPQDPAAAVTMKVSGSEGLKPVPDSESIEVGAVDAGQVYRATVTLTPTADGVQYVSVEVDSRHEDVIDARSFSLPIIVSSPSIAAAVNQRE